MASSVNNIQIVPVNIYWRMEQTETWDFEDLTKALLSGTSLKFWSALDAAKHYIWFDDTGSVSDPALSGFTAHKVTVTAANTPAQIATAVAAVVTAITGFDAAATDSIVRVVRTEYGETTESLDVDTDAVITLTRRGRDIDLGLLKGDIEPSLKPSNFMVKAHQYGPTPVAAINQGAETEVTTTLQETQTSALKDFYKIYGGVQTPMGGTEVFGVGSAAQGKNMMVEAGRLIMKPINATNDTENANIMLALPTPGSLVFSGENPRTLEITWTGFVDRDFNSKFNIFAFGDIGQDGL